MSTKEDPSGVEPQSEGKGLSADQVAQMINSALSSHFKRFKSDLEQIVKPPEARKAEETELQTLRRKMQEFEDRATKAELEARTQRTETRLRSALAEKGLAREAQDLALAYLQSRDIVSYSEEGEPIVTLKKAKAKGSVPEPVAYTLEEGVHDWLQSDAIAKPLLPAPKPTGRPAPTPGASSTSPSAPPSNGQARQMSPRQREELIGRMMSGVGADVDEGA